MVIEHRRTTRNLHRVKLDCTPRSSLAKSDLWSRSGRPHRHLRDDCSRHLRTTMEFPVDLRSTQRVAVLGLSSKTSMAHAVVRAQESKSFGPLAKPLRSTPNPNPDPSPTLRHLCREQGVQCGTCELCSRTRLPPDLVLMEKISDECKRVSSYWRCAR